jgi:hypothetical protein
VSWFRQGSPKKPFKPAKKPFLPDGEDSRKSNPCNLVCLVKQWSSIMSALITLIYREYCRARLAEMRKHLIAV